MKIIFFNKHNSWHRTHGPAFIKFNGHIRYYLNDKYYNKEEYYEKLK